MAWMDLFDFEQKNGPDKLGFRLQRLEVYNWGTFDQKVWSLELNGDTSLLTGDVGSGKSTLVDALITLLVPPRKATYNKAADASAKERSLNSYVRGYFAQKRTEEGGGKPEALRDINQYSVLLAVFADKNLGVTVSLAQVFWFRDASSSTPAKFFVLADKTLSIADHFSNFGTDIKNLKKRLDRDAYIKIYEDYPQYARDFRRKFGIRQEQAMDLFQQTISMKKVDALTGFVRQNMLEIPNTENEVKSLLLHFYDLDKAHDAVVKAKAQLALLQPLAIVGDSYFSIFERNLQLQAMQKTLRSFFAFLSTKFLLIENDVLKEDEIQAKNKIVQLQEELQVFGRELKSIEGKILQNGGQRLESLQQEIKQDEDRFKLIQGNFQQYEKQAKVLSLEVPETQNVFEANRKQLDEKTETEHSLKDRLAEELSDYDMNRKELEKELERTAAELSSLRLRKSSIPREYVEIRDELCRDLDLAETEMPFAGELMEVKAEEAAWEGAVERLLRGLGISLLIPQAHYAEVADWMEHKSLRLRLVYYRVNEDEASFAIGDVPEDSACQKINLRQDSVFSSWLQKELYQRFRHICCETMAQFRSEAYAMTKGGQVKMNGRRHEKDDRHKIDDRRQYVLGFSNHKKIQALEVEVENANLEIKRWKKLSREVKSKQDENSRRLSAIEVLRDTKDFISIDVVGLRSALDKKRKMLLELEKENDALRLLKQKERELYVGKARSEESLNDVRAELTRAEMLLTQNNEKLHSNTAVMDQLEKDFCDKVYPRLEENWQQALGQTRPEKEKLPEQENQYGLWLAKEIDANQDKLTDKRDELTKQMLGYLQKYPQETNSLDTSPEALPEYKAILHKLEIDGLPKFEAKFRELLRENTINQIALFQGKLAIACDEIRDRIDMINQSLSSIDYNEGRYIAIEYTETVNREIKDFRLQLKACTDSVLSGSEDDQYSEGKFSQVKEIVERFKGRPGLAELDEQWMKKVIDVRNWYEFAASERWRDTGEEYEHYTDSGGKSGGQKEKLAYTILAASLVYNFGLEAKNKRIESFRFVVIDEAFLKSSDDSARFGLELFKKLDLQLLVVTPLLKIATIEPFVTHVGFVYQNDEEHISFLRNLTIEELREERQSYAAK
jgi:uncharacterized protein YPO0396